MFVCFAMKIIRFLVRAVSGLNEEAVLTTNTEYTEKVFANLAKPYKDKWARFHIKSC